MFTNLKISLIWCVFLVMSAKGFAQQGQLLTWEHVGDSKELNAIAIGDIYQDTKGFLWLAAWEGLVRFDGHSFRFFRNIPGDSTSIYNNHVRCISEDRAGNMWVGLARGGVSRYDRETGQFRNYPFTENLKIKTTPIWRLFFDRKGELWVGLDNYGLAHLNKETGDFKIYDLVTAQSAPHLTPEEIPNYNVALNFWEDEDGLFWIATRDDLYHFDPVSGKATSHRFEKFASNGTRLNQAYAIFPEDDGLWVGGWASGLRHYNRRTKEWKQYMFEDNPLAPDGVNVVNSIFPKSNEEFWITSEDKGLCIFNKKTGQFTIINQDQENYPDFPKGAMQSLYIDRQGNLWLSNEGNFLRVQIQARQFHFNSVKSGLPVSKENSWISTIFEDQEGRFRFTGMYAGDGLHVFDKKTGKTTVPTFKIHPNVDESNLQVRDIMQARDGTIWVLGRHILYRFNPLTLQLEVPLQPPVISSEVGTNYYTQMTEDGNGHIWLGSVFFGAFRYIPETGQAVHFMPDTTKTDDLPTNIIGFWETDRLGRPWYAGRDQTVYGYYHIRENRFVYLNSSGKVTDELTSMRVNSLYADKNGDVWACSEQGLLHFDCTTEPPTLLKKYTLNDGLASDYAVWAREDNNGDLWVVAGKNLCRLDVNTDQILSFGKKDGYPVANLGIGKLDDGHIFLLVHEGYYTFHPDSLIPGLRNAPVALTSFKVNDEERYFGSVLKISQSFVVPADGRYFSLEFASLDFTHPELCKFEYQLEGLNKRWVRAGNRRLVNYTNVPTGQYSFKVKLEDRPDTEALVIPLIVKVAFYKTSWFWGLFLMAILAAVFAYYRNRQFQKQQLLTLQSKAQLLEKEKALVQYESLRQQLNPHFLFNSLTSLSSLISIDPKGATTFLNSLSKTYRYILKSSEMEVVPLVGELEFGASFVKLQKTRFGEGLQVNFKVNEADFHRKIVPVTLQNLIENAIKHNIIDEEEPLVVDVSEEEGYLVVRNNLQKKKFVETSNKRGLTNLKSFYRYLSDKEIVVVEDGQFFTIKIPLI